MKIRTMALMGVVAAMMGGVLLSRGALGADGSGVRLAPPVLVMADGKPIDTGEAWGHSAPCVQDLDGDGVAELIVGDFSGTFRVYKNVGTAKEPAYKAMERIKGGNEDAKVWIYCCIGGQARFCDLDGDGISDMISNSYDPGHCYVFRGLGGGKFAAREEIKDKSGVPVRSSPVQKQNVQSFGSFVTPVDWDADGDMDLLIGCFRGELKVRMNQGTAKKAEFATDNLDVLADGKPMKVKAHFCPVVADWDGDGQWDIIAGSDDGSVTWFKNVGAKGKPVFAAGETLVEAYQGTDKGYNIALWDGKPVPGIRTQVEVCDFNGDGKLDLLVGDFYTAYEFRKDLSDEQKQEVKALIEKSSTLGKAFGDKMEAMRADFMKRYTEEELYSDKVSKEWSQAYQELRKSPEAKQMEEEGKGFAGKMKPFLAETRGAGDSAFDLAKAHGHLWVYVRE